MGQKYGIRRNTRRMAHNQSETGVKGSSDIHINQYGTVLVLL
jgi:hypothetical protein